MTGMPKVGDVCTDKIIYFDSDFEGSLKRFCQRRDIDQLPGYEGNTKNILDKGSFEEQSIEESEKVNSGEGCLDPKVIDKFTGSDILFVYDSGKLTGIMHFCDYNSRPIYEYLYKKVFDLETSLRELFKTENLSDSDLTSYFKTKAHNKEEDNYYTQTLKRLENADSDSFKPFQHADLGHLISFLHTRSEFNLTLPQNQLRKFRNKIMHEKQFIEHISHSDEPMHYDKESLHKFEEDFETLTLSERKVKNQIRLRAF
ncbi:MAG: hypothetical protein ACI8Z7_000652 [Candidatus Nanohaloarchaea archaeon]|jgi:hypothetical protein